MDILIITHPCRDLSTSLANLCKQGLLVLSFSECIALGKDYNGRTSSTKNGFSCQRWDSQSPHIHGYTFPHYFVDDTVEDAGWFCRNPGAEHWDGYESWPWCYTVDTEQRWGFCDVESPLCGKELRNKYWKHAPKPIFYMRLFIDNSDSSGRWESF